MKTILAIAIGTVGVFFVASGVQGSSNIIWNGVGRTANWFGQECVWNGLYSMYNQSWCVHPEWFAGRGGASCCGLFGAEQARE